jgi:hypothetical protein
MIVDVGLSNPKPATHDVGGKARSATGGPCQQLLQLAW